MLLGELGDELDQRTCTPLAFLGVLGHAETVVLCTFELGLRRVGACQESVCQRREGGKRHIELFDHREERLMPSCHDRVAVLDSSNRADRIGAAQILFVCLRDAPGTNLAFLHEIGHGGSDRLRLDLGIDAVLAAEINMVGLKAPEASPRQTS